MSDPAKLLEENQKEMMKLIVLMAEKSSAQQNVQDSDSETENISVAQTSTPMRTNTVTSKTTPIDSRNTVTGVLNDSTNQSSKKPKQQRPHSEQARDRPTTSRLTHSHKYSSQTTYFQCRKHSLLRYPSLAVSPKNLNLSKTCVETTKNVHPPDGNTKYQLFPLAPKRKRAPSVLQP